MRILRSSGLWSTLLSTLAVLVFSSFWPSSLHAQAALDGKYRCVRIEIADQVGQCQSPPLILSQDGSYAIWGEHGTYEVVEDKWLVLSHSKRRGIGHFVGADRIVFEYKIGNKTCRVTFRQVYDPPPGYDVG
jgi:hypothetical protein